MTAALRIPALMFACATFASLAVWARRSDSPWWRPLAVLAVAANVFAAGLGTLQLPDDRLLIGVMLTLGVQVMAFGVTTSRTGVMAFGPPLIGAAFLLSIAESVGGSAQWYTAPLGLVVLAEVEARDPDHDRRVSAHGRGAA